MSEADYEAIDHNFGESPTKPIFSDREILEHSLRETDKLLGRCLQHTALLKVEQFHELSAAREVIRNIKKEIENEKT